MKDDRAVDGIIGLGQIDCHFSTDETFFWMSLKVFSHCLEGSDCGRCILVLGELMEAGLVYTALVPSQEVLPLELLYLALNLHIFALLSYVSVVLL